MHTKNKISLTRKSLYVIMLLAIFLSAFGAGNLPTVSAQTGVVNTLAPDVTLQEVRTITLIQGTVDSTPEIDAAVILALETTKISLPGAQYYAITDISIFSVWRFVSVLGLENVGNDFNWNIDNNSLWAGLILLENQNNSWVGSVEGSEEFSQMLNRIPDDILSRDAKNGLDPLQRAVQAQAVYHFPWTSGTSMKYGPEGVHANGFNGVSGASGWKAVDLLSGYGTAGEAPNNLRAATAGTVNYKCTPTNGGVTTAIKVNDLFYTHLNNSGDIYVGKIYVDGESIGSLKTGSFNENCGRAEQSSNTFHVHLGFPNTGSVTFDGWTLNMSTGLWTNGSTSKGIGSWFQSGVSSGGGCSPNADQIALYIHTDYVGTCVIKGVGNYADPASMGIENDSVSSVKVGSNVKLTLYNNSNYGSTSETFTNDDSNLSDNSIGENQASSAKVEPRSSSGCSPNADQIAFYIHTEYVGNCVVKGVGNYADPSSMGIENDSISSIKVGSNVKLTLYRDSNYGSTFEAFTNDDSNLSDNSIGENQASSAKVESRSNALPSDYGFCAEEGQTCSFSGTAQIYFGASGQFVGPVSKTDGVACSNDVFGDPISGAHKQCFIKGGRPQGSTFCSNEGGTCSFGGSSVATVYFGVNGKYVAHTGVVSSTACNTATFGDPFSGIGKSCYYTITGSSISTPSNPNPADNTTFARTNNTILSWSTNGTNCTVHIWGGSIDISPSNGCGSLALGNQRGGAYNWQVTASNGGFATGPIWHFNIKPYGSTNLSISSPSATQVTLNWSLSSDEPADIDEYEIYQDGVYIGYVINGVSTYTVTDLDCGSSYSFYVKSKRQGVLSEASNTVSRGVVGCIPAMPDNVTVGSVTQSSLTLNWQDNSNNETGFKIYRWGYDGTEWNFIYLDAVGANVTSYLQTDLQCGSDFNYYEVSSYNGNGESDHTGWVQGATAACPQAELIITDIRINPSSPFTNEDILIEVDIENNSSVDASGFWTDFYIDATPSGCEDWGPFYGWLDGLAANSTFTWSTHIQANSLSAGAHQFRAFVDSGCGITENNESNNISGSANFTLTIPPSSPPSHDDFDSARLASSLPYSNTVDVSGATTAADDPYVPECGGVGLTPGMTSVWYKYTPSVNTSLYLDTFGSSYDTYIAVWSGARGNLSSIACNDDLSGHGLQSGLTVNLTGGTTYYFEVAQFSDSFSASSLSATSTTETDSRPSNSGIRVEQSAPNLKPSVDAEAQAGGTLQFHVFSNNIEVYIGGALQGSYSLLPGQSQKVVYPLDAGPVKIESANGMDIVAALRDALLVNGSLSTFSQLMGLPNEQLSDTYWFPAYVNNSALSGQLRFANVGVADTTVTVTIGGVIRGSYLLHPNEMKKVDYPLDAGPVKVQSSGGVPIVAALRDALVVNGGLSTFSQLMGIPDEQLSDTYWFPAYVNNSTLNGQLRFANVGVADTTVTVTIGGVNRGSYLLHPNEMKKVDYPLDAGPVKVQSSGGVPIVAALRDALLVNGSLSTFSQLMGIPDEGLSDTYWIPAYVNNTVLNGQLRFGNVGLADTTVTVTIGGVDRGSYLLHPNENKKMVYDLDSGPVKITSTGSVPIVAALRDALLVNGSLSTFSQLMGLPDEQLSTIYWLPAYVNNAVLNGQLRFGVP